MLKLSLWIATVLITTACSNQPKTALTKPVVRSIAIIPATDPTPFAFENKSAAAFVIPLVATVNHLDSKTKAKEFNEKLLAEPLALGAKLTNDIATELRRYGYQVQILEAVSRPVDDIDNVDYKTVSTHADAVLHLRFTKVGMFSPRSSTSYLPRVNAQGTVFVTGREDDLYDEEITYGVDTSSPTSWAIVADPKFAYPSFEAVLAAIGDVRQVFSTGSEAISRRMARQVHDAVK